MNYKGAVFFDIDGTLVDERNKIFEPTDNVKNAIKQLKQNGYLTGIATGRAKSYVPDLGIDFDCYITCNGAVVDINGEEIHCEYFPENDVREIVELLEREETGYVLEDSKHSYYKNAYEGQFEKFLNVFRVTEGSFVPMDKTTDIRVNKMLVYAKSYEQIESMRLSLKGRYGIETHHQGLTADIINKNISKATGIERVAEHIGISIKDTYAFGDDGNDYLMLKKAGHGIAMTPHAEILEEVADDFALSVKEDGVCHSLKKLGLI